MSVHAYHPGTGAALELTEEQLAHLRASGWLTREEHEANQAAAAEQAARAASDTGPARASDSDRRALGTGAVPTGLARACGSDRRAQRPALDGLRGIAALMLERDLRVTIEQSGNTVAAYIGEVEDLLQTKLGGQDRIKPD